MHRVSSQQAGYMELDGATKDADCERVEVHGGVSKELGCCNLFEHEENRAKQFRCGTCEYVRPNKNSLGAMLRLK